MLKELHAIDRSQLSPEDQLNYDVFEYNSKDFDESEQHKWYLVRTNTFQRHSNGGRTGQLATL